MRRCLIYVIMLVIPLVSCDRIVPGPDDFKGELISRIATKDGSDESGNVYRIYLNVQEGYQGTPEATGTYYHNGTSLVPWDIEENDSNDAKGLRAENGYYKMHIVYPPVEMSDIENYIPEATGKRGYLITREEETAIYISKAVQVKLDGVYLSKYNGETYENSEYVFDARTMPLKQPRSRVKVNFKCSDNVDEITLSSVTFKNIINQGYFRPVEGAYYFKNDGTANDDVIDVALSPKSTTGAGNGTIIVTKDNPISFDDIYILSMDYGETVSGGAYRWPLPSLVFEIGTGNNVTELKIPLGWNFEQQKEYVFNITMNHIYISNVTVSVSDWVPEGDSASITDPATWEMTVGQDGTFDWELVNGGEPILGTIN